MSVIVGDYPLGGENTSRYSCGSVVIPDKHACDKIWVITFSAIKCLDKIPCNENVADMCAASPLFKNSQARIKYKHKRLHEKAAVSAEAHATMLLITYNSSLLIPSEFRVLPHVVYSLHSTYISLT